MTLNEALQIPSVQAAFQKMRESGYNEETASELAEAVNSIEIDPEIFDAENLKSDLFDRICEEALKPR